MILFCEGEGTMKKRKSCFLIIVCTCFLHQTAFASIKKVPFDDQSLDLELADNFDKLEKISEPSSANTSDDDDTSLFTSEKIESGARALFLPQNLQNVVINFENDETQDLRQLIATHVLLESNKQKAETWP